jgi:osmotically-inducible protein OsmY
MNRTILIAALAMLAFGAAFWAKNGQAQQEGVAAKAGEKIDEVGRAIKSEISAAEDAVRERLSKTGETLREGFARTRVSVHEMGLVSRIYGRLHWDKALQSSTLILKAEDGIVTVRGIVPDDAAKEKAITLIKDTVGVFSVNDQRTTSFGLMH